MSTTITTRKRKSWARRFLGLQIVLLIVTGALPLPTTGLTPAASVASAAGDSKQVAQPTVDTASKTPQPAKDASTRTTPAGAEPGDAACDITFTDVAEGSTYYEFVRCLTCKAVLGGFSDGTFRPNANITRGQLSKIVANAAGLDATPTTQTFEDVPAGSPFYPFIERMAAKGYIGGYPCGGAGEPCGAVHKSYFRPNADATRGQISKIVSNAAGFSEAPSGQTFQDVAPGSTFYEWVQRLTSRNVMSGYACGGAGEPCGAGNLPYFRPQNKATRGQVAKIISNTFFPNCSNAFDSAQDNIGKALDSGKIDYGTFLLYRAYALFGDRRLPEEYIGTGSAGEDSALFEEIDAAIQENKLSGNVQALLQPFLVRPEDPTSIFNTPEYTGLQTQQPTLGADAPSGAEDAIPCAGDWAHKDSANSRYRIWARCAPGSATADPDTQSVISYTHRLMSDMWDPMVTHMGYPLPDKGGAAGGSEAIDIYVVGAGDSIRRGNDTFEISRGQGAVAKSATPKAGSGPANGMSAFILVPRNNVTGSWWRSTLIHEFFHVLQSAHNRRIKFRAIPGDRFEEYWFAEASADWAAAHFERVITWSVQVEPYRDDQHEYHFASRFQKEWAPIHKPGLVGKGTIAGGRLYDAYVWPLFMEQQSGEDTIAQAWKRMRPLAAGQFAQADDVLDSLVPFESNFREFALRNINSDFGGDKPLKVRYQQLDDMFPNERLPMNIDFGVLQPGDVTTFDLPVTSLTSEYFYFETAPNVGYIEVDFSASSPQQDLAVDAVVKKRTGKWEIVRVPTSRKFKLCDVEKAWVAVSNHNRDIAKELNRDMVLKAQPGPCTCALYEQVTTGWNGEFTLHWNGSATKVRDGGSVERGDVSRAASIQLNMTNASTNPDTGVIKWQAWKSQGEVSGDALVKDVWNWTSPHGSETRTVQGNGEVDLLTFGALEIDPAACTYTVQVFVSKEVDEGDGSKTSLLVGLVYAVGIPLPMVPENPAELQPSDLDINGGGGYIINNAVFSEGASVGIDDAADVIMSVRGANRMGIMTASWSFAPKPAAP